MGCGGMLAGVEEGRPGVPSAHRDLQMVILIKVPGQGATTRAPSHPSSTPWHGGVLGLLPKPTM